MDDEELLKMAEALEEVEDLTDSEKKLVEKVLDLLREEKRVAKKDRDILRELYKEHVKDSEDGDEEIDEDDFV